jgi:hypothetical protein
MKTFLDWTNEEAYQEGFFARAELGVDAEHFADFAANCPAELRESGDRAAKLRHQFIKGWKEGACS